jgi:hypothetical protein
LLIRPANSSEWPVCQIADIASAQRMGATLTYARRYALFTLVGIAGEDDLDAPDLGTESKAEVELLPRADYHTQSDRHGGLANRPSSDAGNSVASARPVLAPDESAILRDQLVAQLVAINTADDAAAWAHRNLPAKNSLTAEDAQIVEARFQARLATVGDGATAERPPTAGPDQRMLSASQLTADTCQKTSTVAKQRSGSGAVCALGKTVRLRDKNHRKFVTRQPCLVCGRLPSDSHHLTFTQPRALGHRVSDEFTVPVCRIHHLHRSGDEAAWWQKLDIDPIPVALRLWRHTRADGELASRGEGAKQSQATRAPDMPAQDRAGVNLDPNPSCGEL